MPIDPTLALQTQQPNLYGQLGQLQALQAQKQNIATGAIKQQQDTQDLQSGQLKLAQQQQGAQDQTDTRAAYAAATDPQTGQVDKLKLLSTLGKLNPTMAAQTAQNLTLQDTAAKEAKAKADAAQIALAQSHINLKDKLLQGATPATWANTRAIALQNGVQPQEIPEQWPGDEWVAQAHAQTMSQKDTLDAHLKSREADQKDQAQAETEDNNAALRDQAVETEKEKSRHDKADEGIQGGKLALEREKFKQDQADASGIPGPTVADRNRASLAKVALANIDKIDEILKRRGDMIGPGAGRVSNIDQIIGSNDPDLVALVNEAHNFSMANAGVHGSRSVQNVRDAVHDLLGDLHNGAKGVQGGLDANRANLQAIIENGGGSKAPSVKAPAKPAGVPDGAKWDPTGNGGKGSWKL